MTERWFTPDEANRLLPAIREELIRLQETKRAFADKLAYLRRIRQEEPAAEASGGAAGEDPFFQLECELEFLQIEARSQIRSFQLKGVQLKDIDTGLVDFPSRRDGEDVLLCWRMGEEKVAHYHGWDEGFAGRKPLEERS